MRIFEDQKMTAAIWGGGGAPEQAVDLVCLPRVLQLAQPQSAILQCLHAQQVWQRLAHGKPLGILHSNANTHQCIGRRLSYGVISELGPACEHTKHAKDGC